MDFDFDLVQKVLCHPLREPEHRRGRGHREFVVPLRALGVHADRHSIEKVAMEAAQQIFGRVNPLLEADIHLRQQAVPIQRGPASDAGS